MPRYVFPFVTLLFWSLVSMAGAQDHTDQAHGHHRPGAHPADETQPTEPGQDAFGAIAEIVGILRDDPKTDWSRVNIDALRTHLIDMNVLTLESDARMSASEDSITFEISGAGRTLAAIHAMVPAHAAELSKSTDWRVEAMPTKTGAILTVIPKDPADNVKIKALGFFGVMAMGAHHQKHHLMMARGQGHGAADK